MTTLHTAEGQDEGEEEEEIIFRSQLPPSPIPSDLSLPEFVLQRADEYPDAVAIVDASTGRSYTYAQVDQSV
jgi:4-coumarate--CoA ligase